MDPHSFYLLDPDPLSEKLRGPDPQKINADPQPCLKICHNICKRFVGRIIGNFPC